MVEQIELLVRLQEVQKWRETLMSRREMLVRKRSTKALEEVLAVKVELTSAVKDKIGRAHV